MNAANRSLLGAYHSHCKRNIISEAVLVDLKGAEEWTGPFILPQGGSCWRNVRCFCSYQIAYALD